MKSLRVVEAPNPVTVRKPVSGPRERLRDLLDQQARAASRIKDLELANERLDGTFTKLVAADAAVKAFDQAAAFEMLAWSKASLKKDPPTSDSDTKLKLLTELSTARDQAHAANSARIDITTEIQKEAAASQALEPDIQQTIAEIIAAEASGAKLDELREAVTVAVAKQVRLKGALQALISIANSGNSEVMRPTFVLMEGLAETLRVAAAPSHPDGNNDRDAWLRLAMALRADPLAELEA